MHISKLAIVILIAILLVVVSFIWLLKVFSQRERYTRERFAFAALTSLTTLGASMIAAFAHNETIWEIVANLIRDLRGVHTEPEPAHVSDHILMVVVFALILFALLRIYEKWDGAISERQYQKQRYREPMPLIREGLYEAKRVFKGEPPPEMHNPKGQSFQSALEGPQDTLAWHLHARDLICLRSPSYEIDRDQGWHHEARCWIGVNKRSSDVVAIRCEAQDIDNMAVAEFVGYVRRVSSQALKAGTGLELFLAIRSSGDTGVMTIAGHQVRKESEATLLEGLVDFSDYFVDISYRAERQPLPDSGQTLSQVYTPPSCVGENREVHENIESYLESWLLESSQRQLALLGEYGQGKSTTALMFVHKLIRQRGPKFRTPILIELRGKSPRNMTVQDILAAWAFPYRIDPLAVMKLLIAGRVFLILEGFDEMALVGDSEARLSHFRTLWGFCYPQAKILITGRPNFFLDDNEMRAALGISKSATAGPYCEALHLRPFDLRQIEHALRATTPRTRREILELAVNEPKFLEIVARGSLLYLVSQLWERERLSDLKEGINSVSVIELFIQNSYRRQSVKATQAGEFMVLNESERGFFMDGIAAYMGALRLPNQISRDDFGKIVKTLYDAIPESVSTGDAGFSRPTQKPLRQRLADVEDAITDVANDVRSGGILVVDQTKSGALRFAHKSFMEYLIGRVYADKILGRNREISAALLATTRLKAGHLTRESLKFFAELLVTTVRKYAVREGRRESLSRQLFGLIVVRGLGGGLRGRTFAAAALAEAKYVVRLDWYRRPSMEGPKKRRFLRRFLAPWLLFFYPRMFIGPPLAMMITLYTFFSFRRPQGGSLLYANHERILLAVALTVLLLTVTSFKLLDGLRSKLPSEGPLLTTGFGQAWIMLWFTCCILGELKPEDVSEVVGASLLQPFFSYADQHIMWFTRRPSGSARS